MRKTWFAAVTSAIRDDRGASLAEYAIVSATLGLAMLAGYLILRTGAGGVLNADSAGWASFNLSTTLF
jgi:Flp pilus assembly pilin Flp